MKVRVREGKETLLEKTYSIPYDFEKALDDSIEIFEKISPN